MSPRYILATIVVLSLAWGLHAGGVEGDGCSVFYPCAAGFQCEAWYHVCRGPAKEGERCHATRHCGPGLQCEAGTHVCMAPGKAGDRCHATRHCQRGYFCQPWSHECVRMGNIGERCVSGFNSAHGRRCNYQRDYWCDPFTHRCLAPSKRGNICGYLGEKEDSGECASGLKCDCDFACSIQQMLSDLRAGLSDVAATVQDLVGRKRFCCKCV